MRAAAKEPTPSSRTGRAPLEVAAAEAAAGAVAIAFAGPEPGGAWDSRAAPAAAVIRRRPSAPANVRRKFFRQALKLFSVSSRKRPAAGQLLRAMPALPLAPVTVAQGQYTENSGTLEKGRVRNAGNE